MQNYELTIVLDGGITSAKKKSTVKKVTDMISTFGGKIKSSEDWGERDLAYIIGKSTVGIFLYFSVELKAEDVKALSTKLTIDEDVIRYLLVKAK